MIARKFLQDKHEQIMMELLFPVLFFFPPLTNPTASLIGAIKGMSSIKVAFASSDIKVAFVSLDVEDEDEIVLNKVSLDRIDYCWPGCYFARIFVIKTSS